MALDEASRALLDQYAASGAQPLHELTPAEARERAAAMRGQAPPGPDVASVTNTRVTVTGGSIPLRVFSPGDNPRAVIVWYHGGGWVLGGLEDSDATARRLVQRTGCVVVLVDYRLAPEYRFPTAVEDSWVALTWAASHLQELAGGPVPLVIGGDSAGGNLAAVMAQKARAKDGQPAIAAQILVYPATDADTDTVSYRDPENQLILTKDAMVWFWEHYAPEPAARLHPDASPLRAGLYYGLPPAVILTAEHDVLRDEGELYATQMMKFGVPVLHQRAAGQMHGFFGMAGLPGAEAGLDFVADGLEKILAGS